MSTLGVLYSTASRIPPDRVEMWCCGVVAVGRSGVWAFGRLGVLVLCVLRCALCVACCVLCVVCYVSYAVVVYCGVIGYRYG